MTRSRPAGRRTLSAWKNSPWATCASPAPHPGPAAEAGNYSERPVVHARRDGDQACLLVRAGPDDPVPAGWQAHPVGLEELALAYLREPAAARPGPARGQDTPTSEVTR